VSIAGWGGAIGAFSSPPTLDPAQATFVFAGGTTATTTITTLENQRVTGVAEAPLAHTMAGVIRAFRYDLCFQPADGGPLTNFTGPFPIGTYSVGELNTLRTSWTASATRIFGAGTWRIGFCVASDGNVTITYNDNDFVNGWVMVTNQ
jgi:hypothetical protein